MKLYTKSITTSIAAAGEGTATIKIAREDAGMMVKRIGVAARESSGAEVARRLIALQIKSGGLVWPREEYANAELVTGTGLNSSDQAEVEIVRVDSGGEITVKVVNNTAATTIAVCDLAVWIDHV